MLLHFQKQFGVNFLSYLTELRIKAAVSDLTNTDKTIEAIAVDSGFPNSNAFTSAFKKEYGMLPSAYRRKLKKAEASAPATPIVYNEYMSSLRKYLNRSEKTYEASVPPLTVSADFSAYKNTPIYNFAYTDRIFDFLISIGLKPLMQFSYMPKDLAKRSDRYMLNHLVSEPKDINVWCDLIHNFLEHLIKRYGIHEILTWKFSVWHQPNTPSRLFGFESFKEFEFFYKKTYDTVKFFNKDICFGLPCIYYLPEDSDNSLLKGLLNYCFENNCIPDYINYSFYDTSLNKERNSSKDSFGFMESMTLNTASDGLKHAISHMKNIRQEFHLSRIPLYISEWNNTPSQQDYLNDTCFKSCYITKNILENYDRIDGIGYWAISDLMSEQALPDAMFFGGLGLFTANALPKPGFYAMRFINALGDIFIDKGNGWFATRTSRDIRIIAYNYDHFSELYAEGERFDMTESDRYTMFENSQSMSIDIKISDLDNGSCHISEYILNRRHGSIFDTYQEIGGIDPHSVSECEYLEHLSIPGFHRYMAESQDNSLEIKAVLEPLEVRLITVQLP